MAGGKGCWHRGLHAATPLPKHYLGAPGPHRTSRASTARSGAARTFRPRSWTGDRDRVPDHSWLSRSRTRLPHKSRSSTLPRLRPFGGQRGSCGGDRAPGPGKLSPVQGQVAFQFAFSTLALPVVDGQSCRPMGPGRRFPPREGQRPSVGGLCAPPPECRRQRWHSRRCERQSLEDGAAPKFRSAGTPRDFMPRRAVGAADSPGWRPDQGARDRRRCFAQQQSDEPGCGARECAQALLHVAPQSIVTDAPGIGAGTPGRPWREGVPRVTCWWHEGACQAARRSFRRRIQVGLKHMRKNQPLQVNGLIGDLQVTSPVRTVFLGHREHPAQVGERCIRSCSP